MAKKFFNGVYEGRRVFVTGASGFKGSWLCHWLTDLGARVTGFSLYLPSNPCHFEVIGLSDRIRHVSGDVRKLGELMGRPRAVETMVAVIGLDSACIEEVIRENGLSAIDVANFNSPSQTVVSGPSAELERAGPIFERAGASAYVPLPVSAAFHSRYMADAGRAFADFLAPMTFRRPEVPVIANVTGRLYGDDDTSETVRSLLTRQITHPVQWLQSVRYVLAQGSMEFVEVGPRNVLTPLVQQIRRTMDAASR